MSVSGDTISETVLPVNIIKEGLVTKQGGRIKTWKKRWCVLAENGLLYYKTKEYSNLQGHIELKSIENVEHVSEKEKLKKKYCFKIITPGRTFVISAINDEDMENWIDNIKKMKEKSKSGLLLRSSSHENFEAKSLEELEHLLSNLDDKMKTEISQCFDNTTEMKDLVIEELIDREIEEVKHKYSSDIDELNAELKKKKKWIIIIMNYNKLLIERSREESPVGNERIIIISNRNIKTFAYFFFLMYYMIIFNY